MGVRSSITECAQEKAQAATEVKQHCSMPCRERSHHWISVPTCRLPPLWALVRHLLEWAGVALVATSGPSHLVGNVPQLVIASAPSCLGRPTHP